MVALSPGLKGTTLNKTKEKASCPLVLTAKNQGKSKHTWYVQGFHSYRENGVKKRLRSAGREWLDLILNRFQEDLTEKTSQGSKA